MNKLCSLLHTVVLKAPPTVALVSVNAVLCKAAPSGEEYYEHVQICLPFILQMNKLCWEMNDCFKPLNRSRLVRFSVN